MIYKINFYHHFFVKAFVVLTFFCSAACSLKYTQDSNGVEERVPEFIFSESEFKRYENNAEVASFSAETVEQYRSDRNTYAKDVNFSIRNKDGNVTSKGECSLLAMESKTGNYSFYDNIEISNSEQNFSISANELKWNEKSEQLISGRGSTITIKKDGTTIHGSGFSASNVTNTFQFVGAVSGIIETEDGESGTDE